MIKLVNLYLCLSQGLRFLPMHPKLVRIIKYENARCLCTLFLFVFFLGMCKFSLAILKLSQKKKKNSNLSFAWGRMGDLTQLELFRKGFTIR